MNQILLYFKLRKRSSLDKAPLYQDEMRVKQSKNGSAIKKTVSMILCGILAVTLLPSFPASADSNPAASASKVITAVAEDNERSIDFNDNWQFYLATRTPALISGNIVNGLQDPPDAPAAADIVKSGFDDRSWRTLNVPHDWSIEGQKLAGSSNSQGYLQGGLGWYRKTFTLPESMGDKKIAIDFEGVYADSVVYVNGNLVGEYPSGYTGFSYDITPYVTLGSDQPNVIAVKVQNMAPSGRWYTGSGITRPVSLVVTDKTRFLRHGLTYTTPGLEAAYKADKGADLAVTADIYSEASNGVTNIRTSVIAADGSVVATHTSDVVDYNPSTKLTLNDSFKVPDVHLWSIDDPYLYTIRTELITEINGGTGPNVVDSIDTSYGFRWVEIKDVDVTDADASANSGGFYLNGVYTKLQGVDLHHDDGALGAASTLDAAMRKFRILKDMGVNAFRTSHNPPSKEVILACEKLGIVVMEEAFDGWGSRKATYDFGNWFLTSMPEGWAGSVLAPVPSTNGAQFMWSDWVLQEMVNRDKNSPAVIMWSIGNEVRGVGTKPAWMNTQELYGVASFNEYSEAIRLKRDVLAIDPSRPVVMGGDQERTPPTPTSVWGLINNYLDGYGLNYNTAQSVDTLATRFPNTFFFESESSSQTSARGVYQDVQLVNTGVNQTPGSRGTSSYDNNFASWTMGNEYGLKKDRDRKPFIGQFIWTGFDYIGEPTPYNVYPVGVSSFGAIDTAGFPKDSFYLFQSQWTSEPMSHIVPMNWTSWTPGEIVDVWVNTNQQSAELFLNGESLGRKSFDIKTTNYSKKYYETSEPTKDDKLNTSGTNTGGYLSPTGEYGKLHLTWKVPFAPGTLEVKTYADPTSPVVTSTDVVKTAGQPYTLKMTADKPVITADGRSLAYIETDVVDENGSLVPDANQLVKFNVMGGSIVGVDNGQQESAELYKWDNVDRSVYSERSAYNGKVLVIVQSNKGQTGPITVTASFDGSAPAQATVFAAAADATGNVGITPVTLHVKKGDDVNLPAQVTVVKADGTTSRQAVSWSNIPASTVAGSFQATASVGGLQAIAYVDVYDFAEAGVSVAAAKGDMPVLPANVKVRYTNGLSVMKPVTWEEIAPSQLESNGVITVNGQIAGLPNPAKATVVVTDQYTPDVNLARSAAGTGTQDTVSAAGPLATATFTNGTSYPNLMLDGNKTSAGWSNRYSISATANLPAVNNTRPYEFVQVYWPKQQNFDSMKLYFAIGGTAPTNNLPKSLDVQYWDGLKWVSAGNQNIAWAAAANEATTITFDSLTSAKVRVGMENATPYSSAAGAMTITELEVLGNQFNEPVIQEIPGIHVTTTAGVAPILPPVVEAVYSDGSRAQVAVTWNAVDPASYAQAGSFTVNGTVSGSNVQAAATVAVTEDSKVTGVSLNKDKLSLTVGGSETLIVTVEPEGAANKTVTWSVYDPAIAAVSDNGTVTAVSPGETYVTATTADGGFTAKADVTVTASDAPNTSLTGPAQVSRGQTFVTSYGLDRVQGSVIQEIYAQDVSITFDTAAFEFVEAVSVKEGLAVVDHQLTDAGQLRLILASQGPGGAIRSDGPLVDLKWKVKDNAGIPAAAIQVASATLSSNTGQEAAANGSVLNIQLLLVDKSALNTLISTVQAALSAAVEGTKSGQYPAGSKAILQAELTSAEQTASDSAATQAQVDHAGESLNNALQLFLGKQIAAIPGDVNGDGKVSIGDLGIISANYGLNSEDSSWNEIKRLDLNNDNVIDIMDLIVVARNILV